jgi:hypothetical protein
VRRASAAFRGVIVLLLGRFAAVRRRHRCPSGLEAADPWATAALADTTSMTTSERSWTFFM